MKTQLNFLLIKTKYNNLVNFFLQCSLLFNQFKLEFHRIMVGYIALVAISTMEIFIYAQRSLKNISKKVALKLGKNGLNIKYLPDFGL